MESKHHFFMSKAIELANPFGVDVSGSLEVVKGEKEQ